MIQYACCRPIDLPSHVQSCGTMAPPAIPTINKAEAALVNFPNPFMAKGQIAGQTNALANPRIAIKKTETVPVVKMAPKENSIPSIAENFKAVDCEIYFGIATMPIIYPASIPNMV